MIKIVTFRPYQKAARAALVEKTKKANGKAKGKSK